MGETYELIDRDGMKGITCLPCGLPSYHPEDVAQLFCGCCGRFHDDPTGYRDVPLGWLTLPT